jgi:hypothetical protein
VYGAFVMDDDILSQGEDREPGPRSRRVAVVAALIAAAVGGAAYLGIARHQDAPAPATQAPAKHPPAAALPSPVIPSSPGAVSVPPGPDGIAGRTLAWEHSLRLPSAGSRPVWFSPASGLAEPIAGLPPGPSGYEFTRVNGGWAVQPGSAGQAQCGDCAGVPLAVWFLADGARAATPLGTASLVAPAAAAGAVWLTTFPRGAPVSSTAGTAREVGAAAGQGQSRPVRLPRGYAIVRGTDRGLLLALAGQPLGTAPYKLWNPLSPRASRTFHAVLAASAGAIAWTSPCAPRCAVQLLDLTTGRHTVITLPAGSSPVSGAFSPDGDYLALQVGFGSTAAGGELAMQLEVAPVATGRLAIVPGTWVSSDALIGFGWPARGDSLVAEFSFTTKMELASWHPGASYPSVTVIRPGLSQAFFILG